MSPEHGLAVCIIGVIGGVVTLPVEFLPHRKSVSFRLVAGCLMMIVGGAGLGKAFLA